MTKHAGKRMNKVRILTSMLILGVAIASMGYLVYPSVNISINTVTYTSTSTSLNAFAWPFVASTPTVTSNITYCCYWTYASTGPVSIWSTTQITGNYLVPAYSYHTNYTTVPPYVSVGLTFTELLLMETSVFLFVGAVVFSAVRKVANPPEISKVQKTTDSMKFCRECGAKIPRDSVFCEECGSNLP